MRRWTCLAPFVAAAAVLPGCTPLYQVRQDEFLAAHANVQAADPVVTVWPLPAGGPERARLSALRMEEAQPRGPMWTVSLPRQACRGGNLACLYTGGVLLGSGLFGLGIGATLQLALSLTPPVLTDAWVPTLFVSSIPVLISSALKITIGAALIAHGKPHRRPRLIR